jgi:hypothetical protein
MGKGPRKPTGEIGAFTFGPSSPKPIFSPVVFPESKADIEQLVAGHFVEDVKGKRLFAFDLHSPPRQNLEDDFDFTIHTDHGILYLELTEAFLRDIGEGLSSEQFAYSPYVAAEHVWKQVQKKSDRYRGATTQPIVLLIYVTHWQFCFSDHVFWHLAYRMAQSPPVFLAVFYLSFLEASTVNTVLLYPTSRDFVGYDPERYKNNVTVTLNPTQWQIRSGRV